MIAADLTGERLFFRCGHVRTPGNMQPNGVQHGKPKVRCRACYNERERARWSTNTARREAAAARKREQRAQARKPRIAMRDRIAELEHENKVLKQELNLTLDALIALRDSDRNPEGEKPQALSAEHESAGRRHRPKT